MGLGQRFVITGGIASGKTMVVDLLSGAGWSVIKADVVGHQVLTDPGVVDAVTAKWPAVAVNGEVSRSELARVVFASPDHLSALEAITQPLIVDRIDRWMESTVGLLAVEVPVLKVTRTRWGPVVVAYAPLILRRERALARGMAPADVDARLAVQPSDSGLLAAADFVIDNHGTIGDLELAVRRFDAWARST